MYFVRVTQQQILTLHISSMSNDRIMPSLALPAPHITALTVGYLGIHNAGYVRVFGGSFRPWVSCGMGL